MPSLQIVDTGPIYRNPNPGYQHVLACFSHIVQLSDQEILCAYNQGQAIYATDLTFHQARSTDGGKTWDQHSMFTDRSQDDRHYSYHSPFISRMRDGELVIIAFRVDRTDPDHPIFNEETGGLTKLEVMLQRSGDNGHSWSLPEVLDLPEEMVISPSSAIVELPDGTWFLAFDQWHAFDDPGPYQPRNVAFFSSDRGKTWGDPVPFADGAPQGKGHWHGRVHALTDDRLFALFWSANMTNGLGELNLHRCFGSPDGKTWTTPEATNMPGQTNDVADLGDGRFVGFFTVRESAQPGFRAVLSEDWGKTWDLDNQIVVWDASGRDRLGVSAPDSYPRSHDTIAFGAPTASRLLDGDVLVSFWCTEMSITHVRYARLRVVD